MAIRYTDLDDVKNEYVSINGVTDSYHKLIENDESLINTLQNKPGVWECKWYNDDKIPGYQKGAAVWINTEDIDQFINARYDDIEHYILNSRYRGEYLSISGDTQQTMQLFKNVCNGSNGYDRLYYLGDINQCAQVKVSILSSNNKDLPTVTSSWANAFRLSSAQSYRDIITSETKDFLEQSLSTHIQNYHLSSMTMKELTSTYLLNDFSNISLKQNPQTHNIKNRTKAMSGFDRVIMFADKKDSYGGHRWFRLWSSGYLEHGGQLICAGTSKVITVDLSWKYDGDRKNSIVYDYPVVYDGMYPMNMDIYVGSTTVDINNQNLGPSMTYCATVTPIMAINKEYQKDTVEVFNITNSSFQFSNENSKMTRFSYRTGGFITEPSMNKWGIA